MYSKNNKTSTVGIRVHMHMLPLAACQSGQPESASCTALCETAHPEISGPNQASAQTTRERQIFIRNAQHVHCCGKKQASNVFLAHMGCCFFITEHIGVRSHDRWSRLLRDTGRLRGSFALVHQLLHSICDAPITQKPAEERERVRNVSVNELQQPSVT